MKFHEAVESLFRRTGGATEWSTVPTQTMLAALGEPHTMYPCIHVAGTNGKGSVASLVYNTLRMSGYRAALYTSPHLISVCERMVVDERMISEDAFATWATRLNPIVEALDVSFFEATTAIAFADFAARGAEIAVVETGLGGRLDSTNVVSPLVACVTNIGLEHTDYLGPDLFSIAREKAGIAKDATPLIVGEQDGDVYRVIETEALRRGATVHRVSPDVVYDGPLGMAGAHQRRNAMVAWAVLDALAGTHPTDDEVRRRAFERTMVPGRFQRRGSFIFDVAHNVAGMQTLVDTLEGAAVSRPRHALVGILSDKNGSAMLNLLAPHVDTITVCTPPSAPPHRLPNWDVWRPAVTKQIDVEPDFEKALMKMRAADGTVLITGSFHTVGDAMARLPAFQL